MWKTRDTENFRYCMFVEFICKHIFILYICYWTSYLHLKSKKKRNIFFYRYLFKINLLSFYFSKYVLAEIFNLFLYNNKSSDTKKNNHTFNFKLPVDWRKFDTEWLNIDNLQQLFKFLNIEYFKFLHRRISGKTTFKCSLNTSYQFVFKKLIFF